MNFQKWIVTNFLVIIGGVVTLCSFAYSIDKRLTVLETRFNTIIEYHKNSEGEKGIILGSLK